jgi:hypothetical protein
MEEGFTAFLDRLFPAQNDAENIKLIIAESTLILRKQNHPVKIHRKKSPALN